MLRCITPDNLGPCDRIHHNVKILASAFLSLLIVGAIVFCFTGYQAMASEPAPAKGDAADSDSSGVWLEEWDEVNLEDLLTKWDKSGIRPLTNDEKNLLPYLIYVDMFDEMRGIKSFQPFFAWERAPLKKGINFGVY